MHLPHQENTIILDRDILKSNLSKSKLSIDCSENSFTPCKVKKAV